MQKKLDANSNHLHLNRWFLQLKEGANPKSLVLFDGSIMIFMEKIHCELICTVVQL